MVLGKRLLLLAAVTGQALPAVGADVGQVRADLRVERFVAPTTGSAERPMPVFLGYASNVRFDTQADVERIDAPIVSNTVAIPRSAWGNADDEWGWNLGVTGGTFPLSSEEHADDYYLWTGIGPGTVVADGDDFGLPSVRFTRFQSYAIPHEPTGRAGTMTWQARPGWGQTISAVTNARASAHVRDVGGAATPAPTRLTRDLHLNHVELFASGGDVDAAGAAVSSSAHVLRLPVPAGTVMNLQAVTWNSGGPFRDIELEADFEEGTRSAPTGEWRMPLTATLPKGDFLPQRLDAPSMATPQYVVQATAIGGSLPREPGVGGSPTIVANVEPGDVRHLLVSITDDGGVARTRKLVLDRPGRYAWRVEDGALVPVRSQPAASLALAEPEEEPAPETQVSGGARIEVNAAGRPVLRDVSLDGRRVLDAYDVRRVHTAAGPVELGAANRAGRVTMWSTPDRQQVESRVAYIVDGSLVIARFSTSATHSIATTYVDTHSLDRLPHPIKVEGAADPPDDAGLADVLVGPVERAARFLRSPVHPRLQMVLADGVRYDVEPISGNTGRTHVADAGSAPDGSLLGPDPEVVSLVERDPLFENAEYALRVWSSRDPGVRSGAFTSVRTYRPDPAGGCIVCAARGARDLDATETRDFDGSEPIGLAFGAKKADGKALKLADIDRLFVSLWTTDGRRLFEGAVTRPNFTPDGGTTWGLLLVPQGELASSEILVYARAVHDEGVVTTEGSPDVPASQWTFRIDRIPLTVTQSAARTVAGTTAPHATVTATIPELGLQASARADAGGAYRLTFDMGAAPSGDYEVALHAVTPPPPEGEITFEGAHDDVPDDETGTASARLRHAADGLDPSLHGAPEVDVAAAVAFLQGAHQGGVFGGGLRPTAWAVAGLRASGAEPPAESAAYLASLASSGGSAWRAGEGVSAVPTALAAMALDALDRPVTIDAEPMLRWDGSAAAAPGADVSSLEGAGLLATALATSRELSGFDPWWHAELQGYLTGTTPRGPAEAYARAAGLAALGAGPGAAVSGDDLDAAAYARLLGADGDLARYQIPSGGFTFTATGASGEAFPTGLALAAHARSAGA